MDSLTLDQFAVFAAIVDEGGFAAAARRLNRAQSAITYAIQKLEDQSGTELFDRTAYRPTLTDAGKELLPGIRRILADVDDYRLHARQMVMGLEEELRLAVHPYTPAHLLSSVLRDFHGAFPSVRQDDGCSRNSRKPTGWLAILRPFAEFANEQNRRVECCRRGTWLWF